MPITQPKLGDDLYRILPAIYRRRDAGDLKEYLAVCGDLLDRVYDTMIQRLADSFPDNPKGGLAGPDSGLACQDWLLPYFAELLDVRLVSPLVSGRRDEIAKAIRQRQRKGTLAVAEEIAEAIAQAEFVVQEGWKRVAITPRVGEALLPAKFFGYTSEPPDLAPALVSRHPALPSAMVDFRCPSGAVPASASASGTQTARIAGVNRSWRQTSLHGAPCYPGSYEDPSRRTVDFRTPTWEVGHAHPRRLLLFAPPYAGFFDAPSMTVDWADRNTPGSAFQQWVEIAATDSGVMRVRNRTSGTDAFKTIVVLGLVDLDTGGAAGRRWIFEDLILDGTVRAERSRVECVRCALRRLEVLSVDLLEPVVSARSTLFGALFAESGLARLEFSTVLGEVGVRRIQASDCLFAERIRRRAGDTLPPEAGCVRYSRVSPKQDRSTLALHRSTTHTPIFHSKTFGERSAGVLHPATSEAVCAGAEDGGEMGAFHDRHYCRIRSAVTEKLQESVPIGMETVQVVDGRLWEAPLAV